MHTITGLLELSKISLDGVDIDEIDEIDIARLANRFISENPFIDVFFISRKENNVKFKNIEMLFLSHIAKGKIDKPIFVDLLKKKFSVLFRNQSIPFHSIFDEEYILNFKKELKELELDDKIEKLILQNLEEIKNKFIENKIFAFVNDDI